MNKDNIQKKSKAQKFSTIVAIIGLAGLIISTIAFGFGARTSFFISSGGIHTLPRDLHEFNLTIDEESTDIGIHVDNANVVVKRGDKLHVHATYYDQAPDWYAGDIYVGYRHDGITAEWDELRHGLRVIFSDGPSATRLNFGLSFHTDKTLTITVPDRLMDNFYVESKNGRVEVSNLASTEFKITNQNGATRVNNITSEHITIENENGLIRAHNISTGILNVGNQNGRIEVKDAIVDRVPNDNNQLSGITNQNGSINVENLSGRIVAHNQNGGINFTRMPGNKSDYFLHLLTENGSVRVDGAHGESRNLFTQGSDPTAKNSISARNKNGSIRVDFN